MNQLVTNQNCPQLQFFSFSLDSAQKIAFFDRDGTLNYDEGYTHKKEDLRLIPQGIGVLEVAIKNGWTPVVVSNQSGISKGLYSLESARAFNMELRQTLLRLNLPLDHFIFCIHENFSNCEFRKPGSGMLDFVFNLSVAMKFAMFGNSISDSEAAAKAKIVYSDISETQNCSSILESK